MDDPQLLGKTFKKKWLRGDSWRAWRGFLAGLFGLPMPEDLAEIFRRHTGRQTLPTAPFNECYVIAGRRSGKSVIAALVAVFLACFKSYDDVLGPGEVGTLMILAADRKQSQTIFKYVSAFLEIPLLKTLVVNKYKESIELSNRIRIEIHTSSYRLARGYTLIAAVCDELAFWANEDSANPDKEILAALRPGLATTNGLLIGISSPYAKRGELWENFKTFYGRDDENVLVWRGASREMNPSLPLRVVATAYVRDAASAAAEYGAEFRSDIESFLAQERIEACTVPGRTELAYQSGQHYFGFCDPSGGTSDSMTLGIAHASGDKAILDVLREAKPPFSPEAVVMEFSAVLKAYGVHEVTGDAYGGSWPRERFEKSGVVYKVSERTRSELYVEFLAGVMSNQIELLDNGTLKMQLASLERRATRFGRDSIDHPAMGHDDLANAAAGALVLAGAGAGGGLGLIETLKKFGREIDLGIRDSFGDLLRGPEPKPAAAAAPSKPEAPIASWHPESEKFVCPVCKGSACSRINGPQNVHCNSCRTDFDLVTGEVRPSPDNTQVGIDCCGDPLPQTFSAIRRCGNCGRQALLEPVPRGGMGRKEYFAGMGRSRRGAWG